MRVADDERYEMMLLAKRANQQSQARPVPSGTVEHIGGAVDAASYNYRGCRCEGCREASRSQRAWRAEAQKAWQAVRRDWDSERYGKRQERLTRLYQRGWTYDLTVLRLDAIPGDDADGDSNHDRFALRTDEYDPQRWLESQLLDELVGDLSIADIHRMSDDQLRPLRERLIEAGFATGASVQRKERDRLREPLRHRGEAPTVTFERMAPRHRGRREQREMMAGKRTAKKQRKRWDRGRERATT